MSGPPHESGYKAALRRDFEAWLAGLEEVPERTGEPDTAGPETPALYDFYAQLAALTAEGRKANRRTAEAMSQWGETLARFEGALQPLRETAAQLLAAQANSGGLSRAHCLVLVELVDRMHRLAQAFAAPPRSRFGWGDGAWRRAWEAQRQALGILVSHLEELLRKEGVERIPAAGRPFDPVAMVAVAVEADPAQPPHTVLEEIAAGYLRAGELLRPAQVKISRRD